MAPKRGVRGGRSGRGDAEASSVRREASVPLQPVEATEDSAEQGAAWHTHWVKSVMTNAQIEDLGKKKLLTCVTEHEGSPEYPLIDGGKVVVFEAHIYGGLDLPPSPFLEALCSHYRISLHNLNANAIVHLSIFVTLCECWLGILPSLDLWRYFFKSSFYSACKSYIWCVGFKLRKARRLEYLEVETNDSWKDWKARWCVALLEGPSPIQGKMLVINKHSINDPDPVSLSSVLRMAARVRHLRDQGLRGEHVVLEFMRRGVQPLLNRESAMFDDLLRSSLDLGEFLLACCFLLCL